MSHGLAPSKSTVYVSNLPFSLTNNDLHQIFEQCGRVVKVTIVTNKETRENRGVAFVLFIDRQTAAKAVALFDGKELMGRTLKASMAKDNGRAQEFIRRKTYKDKTQCYQCGDVGHLSYKCPRNLLGEREPPKKKERKRKAKGEAAGDAEEEYEEEEEEVQDDFSLHQAIQHCQLVREVEENMTKPTSRATATASGGAAAAAAVATSAGAADGDDGPPAKRSKPAEDSYFSDED